MAYLIPSSKAFYFSIYDGIRQVADREGYNVLIMNSNNSKEIERKNGYIKTTDKNKLV